MFGGWAYLLHGNLLCGARRGSLLLSVGKDNEAWASEIPGVDTAIMRGRSRDSSDSLKRQGPFRDQRWYRGSNQQAGDKQNKRRAA
jgi:hypothetical protein